jgi:hypothetical protein
VSGRFDHCDWRLASTPPNVALAGMNSVTGDCRHLQSAASQHTQRAPTNMVDDDEEWIDQAADIHWPG